MSWTPDYQFRASYVLWHLRSFTQMNFREFVAAHESVCVKGFGCRPLTSGAACTGGRRPKASKGGNRGKGYVGGAARSMGN